MNSRVEKRRAPKVPKNSTARRHDLVTAFDDFGFEVMPCSRCASKGWKCVMIEGSSKCQECTRAACACDGTGVPLQSLHRIQEEHRRLSREEVIAEERFLELQRRHQDEMNEAIARLIRLRKQKEMARSQGVKLVQRGLRSLDELEEQERQESEATMAVQAGGGFGVIDWNATDFSFEPMPGVVVQTPAVPQRHSPGVS